MDGLEDFRYLQESSKLPACDKFTDATSVRNFRKYVRKRYAYYKIKVLKYVFLFSCICSILIFVYECKVHFVNNWDDNQISPQKVSCFQSRRLLQEDTSTHPPSSTLNLLYENITETTITNNTSVENKALFDYDLFTHDQLRKGAIVLHVIGVIYMFVALALVCDEFFVPSLEVITTRLHISNDVAGATFMAAGGSAPELFTSVIDVFVAHTDVGIGTIVGSAVFNILFVIGMCAIFSTSLLELTWWPLFRDVTFYSISLIALIFIFADRQVYWYEAMILLSCYIMYVTFMKFNEPIEKIVKKAFGCAIPESTSTPAHNTTDSQNPVQNGIDPSTDMTTPFSFRAGLLHLLLKTMDPLDSSHVDEAPMRLRAISSDANIDGEAAAQPTTNNLNSPSSSPKNTETGISLRSVDLAPNSPPDSDSHKNGKVNKNSKETNGSSVPASKETKVHFMGVEKGVRSVMASTTPICEATLQGLNTTTVNGVAANERNVGIQGTDEDGILHVSRGRLKSRGSINKKDFPSDEEPLDMSWPEIWHKKIVYILVLPIVLPLWLCLPDVKKKDKEKWYPVTFIGSILWIGAYSYLMNWWAYLIVRTIGFNNAVMGLIFLSAGTSIPDLISSVLVTRKGFGDMAVSSSVGSNFFDVTIGLPLPWFIYGCINNTPYIVNSKGMLCLVILLFLMLITIIILIAAFKWKMYKGLGVSMFMMYLLFIVLSLLIHYDFIPCSRFNFSI